MSLLLLFSGSPGLTGTLAKTLDDVTLASTSKLRIGGTLNATLAQLVNSATGELDIAGTLAQTLGNVTLVSTATLPITLGTLAQTLGALTLAATGKLDKITATLGVTLGDVTLFTGYPAPDRPQYLQVQESGEDPSRRWAQVMNGAMAGKTNNVGDIDWFSLIDDVPKTVIDPRVSPFSYIGLMPLSVYGEFVRVISVEDGQFIVDVTQLEALPAPPVAAKVRYVVIG